VTSQISKIVFAIVSVALAAPASFAADRNAVAYFDLSGPISEAPRPMGGIGELLGETVPPTMFDLLEKLRAIRTDDEIKGVIFEIDEAGLGFGQIQELRAEFDALRATDKQVWVHCETYNIRNALLGGAAARFYLVPSADVNFIGLYGEGLYFKNMLDNIRVEADILHCGDFKSAGEPFYRTGPSKEAEAQENRLIDSIFDQMLKAIADSRRIGADKVRALMDAGNLTPREVLDAGLVDKLGYREDFVAALKRTYGDDVDIVRDYGKKKGPELNLDNPFAVFQLFGDLMKGSGESDKPAVAVVYVEGMIVPGKSDTDFFGTPVNAGSTTIRRAIAEAAADDNVEALILRVDSPGGSALASDIICEATKRFSKSGRPFIVSMGNVAASGGYYVSALADAIFADPGTITGSIGVVGGKLVTKGLWDWVGVTGHEYQRGRHADMMNTNRRFSDDERKIVSKWMNRIYGEFKDRVLEGRRDRIKGDLEPLAGGRVYSGAEALELGLIDRTGGFADAVRYAAAESELGADYEIRVFPKPKTIFDIFAEAFGGKEKDKPFVSVASRFAAHPQLGAALESVRAIDPGRAVGIEKFLIQMELLSTENVLLIGPPCTMLGR